MVARLTKEQLNYFENPDFYQDYMEMFIFRLTFSNMSIERDLGEIADSKNAIRLRDNYRAFQKLLTMFSYDMSEDLIIDIANTINKSSMYISNGYRKLGRTLGDTNEPISDPKDIKSDMEKLLYNYYNEWNNLDPYLREAKFNIEFLRIHPFEDGNGRTSRLLLNFNLMKQKIAPVIITDDLVDDYFKARNNFDEGWIANMFRAQSEKEFVGIIGGGVSGVISAIYASKNGNKVTILEKNNDILKKLLITGSGRCNYFNSDQNIKHYHSKNEEYLKEIITKENIDELCCFMTVLVLFLK